MAEKSRFDVLLVGCGGIAGGYDAAAGSMGQPMSHAGAYSRHGGFELRACVEPDTARRNEFMRRWRVPVGVSGMGELVDSRGRFDVVTICSPTDLHAEHLQAALDLRPRLIVCEKPVTQTLAQTAECVGRCEASGVPLLINHTRRWAPDVRRLAEALAAGRIGHLRAVNGLYNKGILNNGSHMIDLLRIVCGELEPVAAGAPRYDHSATDPSVPFLLSTQSGVPVAVNVADASDYAVFEVQLVTSTGVYALEDGGQQWRVRSVADSARFPGYRMLDSGRFEVGEYGFAMAGMVANQYDHLATGATLACTGLEALSAQALCERLLEMSKARQAGRVN